MKKEKRDKENKEREFKLSFIQKLNISIVNFEHYYLIAAEGWKRAVIYLTKLLLIFSTILTCLISYKANMTINAVRLYAQESLPDFEVRENQFWIDSDEPISIENKNSTKIIMDNSESPNEYINNPKDSRKNLIIVTKDGIYIKTDYSGEIYYTFENLSTIFNTNNLTKDELIETLSNRKLSIALFAYTFITIFIMYFISMLIDTLALSVVGYLLSRIIGLPLKYSATYGMATSAMSLPIILTLVYLIANLITGFNIEHFQVMITIVSYIYMLAALLIMRSNLINGDNDEKDKIRKRPIRNDEGKKVDEE